MKKLLICTVLSVMLFSCSKKKEPILSGKVEDQYEEGWTRVLAVKGTDTTDTPYMNARTQSALAVDEDTQLKAELLSWISLPGGNANYIIQVTNKTNCQMILRWNWNQLNPVISIEPDDSTAGTPQGHVMQPNQVKVFHFIARAVPGTIFVKSEKSNSDCEPSRQLKLEITSSILPIKWTHSTTTRKGDKMIVNFSTEEPENVDTFFVVWSKSGKKEEEVVKYVLISDKVTKKHTISFPAIKKTTK